MFGLSIACPSLCGPTLRQYLVLLLSVCTGDWAPALEKDRSSHDVTLWWCSRQRKGGGCGVGSLPHSGDGLDCRRVVLERPVLVCWITWAIRVTGYWGVIPTGQQVVSQGHGSLQLPQPSRRATGEPQLSLGPTVGVF